MIEQTGIKEVWTDSAGLQCEFPKAQDIGLQGKLDKFALVIFHFALILLSGILAGQDSSESMDRSRV